MTITAFGPHGVTQTGAVIALFAALAVTVFGFWFLRRASQSGGGKAIDAADAQTLSELRVGYQSEPTVTLSVAEPDAEPEPEPESEPLDLASAHDVEDTPDDEVEIPFQTPSEWAASEYQAILAALRMAPPVKPLVEPSWSFPTPPEVVEALSSGSGMTGFTREAMRKVRELNGDGAIR